MHGRASCRHCRRAQKQPAWKRTRGHQQGTLTAFTEEVDREGEGTDSATTREVADLASEVTNLATDASDSARE
jgi:hypothetical protein